MRKIIMYIGALLANLMLFVGLLFLPPLGTAALENIFTLVWLIFGLLINLGFLREVFKQRARRTYKKQEDRQELPRVRPGALP